MSEDEKLEPAVENRLSGQTEKKLRTHAGKKREVKRCNPTAETAGKGNMGLQSRATASQKIYTGPRPGPEKKKGEGEYALGYALQICAREPLAIFPSIRFSLSFIFLLSFDSWEIRVR